jgi:serine/threonine protein kinase
VNPGAHIGQYRILRKLGGGGMGMVFLGEHVLLERRAAIKTLLPTLSVHAEIVERFFNEARATSAIADAGVVQIFDFGYHVDGTAYIVMELLEGESLADRMERLGTLPVGDALRIARQVASSLASAHTCGIVHRDLKPENIFLVHDIESERGERTKILDFGICKVGGLSDDPGITLEDTMLGTPVYMPPEQCKGASKADHRSDIYALGCVLFHMIVGRPPFECDGIAEYLAAHIHDAPPVPSQYVEALPEVVDELVVRCMAKDPDERFQSMAALHAALESTAAALDTAATEIVATPSHLPLSKGFRSEYDGNVETMVRYVPTPPPMQPASSASTAADATRVDSRPPPLQWKFLTPRPTPDEFDAIEPPRTARRAILGVLLVIALAIAGFAAYDTVADGSVPTRTVIEPTPQPAPVATAPAPVDDKPAAEAKPVDDKPVAEDKTIADKPVEPAVEPASVSIDVPEEIDPPHPPPLAAKPRATVAKAAHHQGAVRRPPPPRPAPVSNVQSPPSTSTEDLYDTR